jgi:hypothetical protein
VAEPCFKCEAELVPSARFCHRCGAPTLSVGSGRSLAMQATPEARAEIKEVVRSASAQPTATRMIQTVLMPHLPQSRTPRKPPLWYRLLTARLWRRPLVWIAVVVLAATTVVLAVVDNMQDKAQQQVGLQRIITRLSSRCFRDSRPQIEAYVARIQASSGGTDSLLDSATLMDFIVRGMRLPQGDCTHIVEALSRPDRFELLFRAPRP